MPPRRARARARADARARRADGLRTRPSHVRAAAGCTTTRSALAAPAERSRRSRRSSVYPVDEPDADRARRVDRARADGQRRRRRARRRGRRRPARRRRRRALLGVVPDDRRSCAPRPRPATVLVVTDRTACGRGAGPRCATTSATPSKPARPTSRSTTDLGDARPRRVPRRAADARRRRPTTSACKRVARDRRTATRSPTRPRTAPATALDGDVDTAWRARGVRRRASASGSASTRRARSPPITSTSCNRSNGGRNRCITKVAAHASTAATRSRRARRLRRARCGRARPSRSRGARSARSRSGSRRRTTTRPNLFGQADAVGFAEIRLRDATARRTTSRVDEVVQMPTDLVDALGSATADHPLVLVMRRDARPTGAAAHAARAVDRPGVHAAGPRVFRADRATRRVSPDAIRSPRFATRSVRDPSVERVVVERVPGRLPRSAVADAAIDGDPHTAWQTPFVGVARAVGAGRLAANPITFDHLDLASRRRRSPLGADARRARRSTARRRELAVPPIADGTATNATRDGSRSSFPAVTGREHPGHDRRRARGARRSEFATAATVIAPVGIAELGIPGLPCAPAPPAESTAAAAPISLAIDGRPVPVRVTGDARPRAHVMGLTRDAVRRRDSVSRAGPPRRSRRRAARTSASRSIGSCSRRAPATSRSRSPTDASRGVGAAAPTPRRVVEVVHNGETKLRVHVTGATQPFWLVLGQSQSPGWHAHVVGRHGPRPVAARRRLRERLAGRRRQRRVVRRRDRVDAATAGVGRDLVVAARRAAVPRDHRAARGAGDQCAGRATASTGDADVELDWPAHRAANRGRTPAHPLARARCSRARSARWSSRRGSACSSRGGRRR